MEKKSKVKSCDERQVQSSALHQQIVLENALTDDIGILIRKYDLTNSYRKSCLSEY